MKEIPIIRQDIFARTRLSVAAVIGSISAFGLTMEPANAFRVNFQTSDYVTYQEPFANDPLWVWDSPCGTGFRGHIYNGHQGNVLSSNYQTMFCYGGTYDWYNVSFDGGTSGWVAGNFLVNNINKLSINGSAVVRTRPDDPLYIWSQPGGGTKLGILQHGTTVTVRERGPVIDVFEGNLDWFRVDQGWVAGEFLQATSSSTSPPPPPPATSPPPPPATSLLFVKNQGFDYIPGWTHVALNIGNQIYESITTGVGNTRSFSQATTEANAIRHQEISLSVDLAQNMKGKIESKLGSSYADLLPFIYNTAPSFQKGGLGQFTCVGLIEWAAESSGFNFGQGYIRDSNEYIYLTPSLIYAGSWLRPGKFSTLTPSLLYWSQTNSKYQHEAWLHALLDPVDFVLTDPMGRRLGYTEQLGLLNEIPGSLYTGDAWAEQLAIPNLIPGNYNLQLFGLDDNANVAFGNSTGGVSFSGYLARGETRNLDFTVSSAETVPEPTAVLGIAVAGIGIIRVRRRQGVENQSKG